MYVYYNTTSRGKIVTHAHRGSLRNAIDSLLTAAARETNLATDRR